MISVITKKNYVNNAINKLNVFVEMIKNVLQHTSIQIYVIVPLNNVNYLRVIAQELNSLI